MKFVATPAIPSNPTLAKLAEYPLLTALRERRSRRFGLGMQMPAGPLAFASRHPARPLSEEEEAAMVFAACGITGYALADLCYAPGGGGGIMAGLVGRTIASGDGLQTVALVVINDTGCYLIRRPRELPPATIPELIELGRRGELVELYRRSRVKIKSGRAALSSEPLFNINANRWWAHAPGSTYFLPINDLTFMYLNGILEVFNETTRAFILDDRNHFRPAGLAAFARSAGGHLDDDPRNGCVATVRQLEQFVMDFVTVEQGMILQNLGLMAQALGLGGFPNFANHEYGWFQALGFDLEHMAASRYLGAGALVRFAMKMLKKDFPVPFPVGLTVDGEVLLKPFCPPHYPSMKEAVHAVVETKFGPRGIFRSPGSGTFWKDGPAVTREVPSVSPKAVAAATAYCEYLLARYGRFPVCVPPYRTVLGFQSIHLDTEFYDRFYRPESLTQTQREVSGALC
jgi:hypothetical protein